MATADSHIRTPETARWQDAIVDCTVLAAVWVFMILLTAPWGNFPLNDDWNYGRSVKALLDEHTLLITHWSLAASLTHIVMGAIPSALFGFSFDALRSVSMLAGLGTGLCVYLTGAAIGAPRLIRLFGSLALLTNPIFLNLSMTFMTDIPFLLLASAWILLCQRIFRAAGLQGSQGFSWRSILLSSILAVLICLSRQTGVVLLVAFFLTVITAGNAWNERSKLVAACKALIPVIAGVAATAAFQVWLSRNMGTLHAYRVERAWLEQLLAKGPQFVAEHCAMDFIVICIYLGTFLFPFMVLLYPLFIAQLAGKERKFALIMFAEPLILLGLGLALTRSKMPLGDNILFDLGLGPLLLGGQQPLAAWGTGPASFWILVTVCGVVGASAMISVLVIVLSRLIPKRPFTAVPADAHLASMLMYTFSIYVALISFRGFFDRYLLFAMLLLLPVFFAALKLKSPEGADIQPTKTGRVLAPLSALLLLLYGCFGVAGTHDYFEWNRARWRAAHDLVDVAKVSPLEIDGGLEFNGWYGYDPRYRASVGELNVDMRHGNGYLLTMQPVAGYDILSRYSFQRWLPQGSGEILVLRKAANAQHQTGER